MKDRPCKECDRRHAYCWGNCKDYDRWIEYKHRESEWLGETISALNALWNYGKRGSKK